MTAPDAVSHERTPAESLALGATLLAGMWLVARPLAGQFNHYSPENGFANAIAMLFALCAGCAAFLHRPRIVPPERLALALLLYLGVFSYALARSPNLGTGVAQYGDAISYVALLAGGYIVARIRPGSARLFTRVALGAIAAQALAGAWQHFVDLPHLQEIARKGAIALPQELESHAGQSRLFGTDVFGSFGNPNSFAAYLLIGVGLLAGTAPRFFNAATPRRIGAIVLAVFFLFVLLWTNSKGAWVACAAALWFGILHALIPNRPVFRKPLVLATTAGLALLCLLMLFGLQGWLPMPESLEVRFDYWRAGAEMILTRPLDGMGLGGFAEHYSYYKVPLGTETRDPHNDYLLFWTDLGVLGPLLYLAIWSVLLRGNPPAAALDTEAKPSSERLVLGACLVAFLMMFLGFQPLNAADIPALLAGDVNRRTLLSLLGTLGQPIIFIGVFLLSEKVDTLRAWRGFGCAAGAILIHQSVDFNFSAPAILGSLFLLGGLFLGERTEAEPHEDKPRLMQKVSIALPFAFTLILLPAGVWFPFASGLARKNATILEDELRQPMTDSSVEAREERSRLLRDFIGARERAAYAAPFDPQAWTEYAEALRWDLHSGRDPLVMDKISAAFGRAQSLRPFAAAPSAQWANFYFETTRFETQDSAVRSRLDLVAKMYASAAERYPLHPGPRLWEGDALLLAQDFAAAARAWEDAYSIDQRIADPNVALSSCFTDPMAGAFPRHGQDARILAALQTLLDQDSFPSNLRPVFEVRRVVAMAAVLRGMQRLPVHDTVAADRLRLELRARMQSLPGYFQTPAEKAHAAFLHAMSFELTGKGILLPHKEAWRHARELQDESILSGKPGTPVTRFNRLSDFYGK